MTLIARKTRCPHCGHDPVGDAEFLAALDAQSNEQPKGMPAEWLDAFEEWRQTLGAADLDGKRDLVWRHIAGTGFQAGAAWARSQAPAVGEPVDDFAAHTELSGVARHKVKDLIASGYRICGYTMERPGHRSAVVFDAAVRWLPDDQRHALMFVEGSRVVSGFQAPTGYALVPLADLTDWRMRVNDMACLTLKAERHRAGADLKGRIADHIDAASKPPVQGSGE